MVQVNISRLKRAANRVFKFTLFAVLAALVTVGIMLAGALNANREFDGTIKVDICKKNAEGRWEVVDNVTGPLRFSATALDVASGKSVGTDFVWRGRTAKGVTFAVRLTRAGSASFDPATGRLDLRSLPFEMEVGDKKERVPVSLTTESLDSPNGPINGKRAAITGRTAQLAVVGVGSLTSASIYSDMPADRKAGKAEQLALVVKADGRLTAK